jgi:hypothetical protein
MKGKEGENGVVAILKGLSCREGGSYRWGGFWKEICLLQV